MHTITLGILPRAVTLTWAIVLCMGTAFGGEIDPEYTGRCGPPVPYGDKIEDNDSKFYFLSDIENCDGERLPELISRVRNVHDQDLIVTWRVNGEWLILRTFKNRLPAGATEENSRAICGYEDRPNTNAIIKYTQHAREKITAAYSEKLSCQKQQKAELRSQVRSAYMDERDAVQEIEVTVYSSISDDELIYEIQKTNSMVDIAVGGLAGAIDGLPDSKKVSYIREQVSMWGNKFNANVYFTTLNEWKPNSDGMAVIPEELTAEDIIVFDTPASNDKHFLQWRIPIEAFESITQTTAPMFLLDPSGEVITTQPIYMYIPMVQK